MKIVDEAGAVVFRGKNHSLQFLIQKSKKDPSKWTFPKGHIEFGETAVQTAIRELEEEAGVAGTPVVFLETLQFVYLKKLLSVQYFLCEYVSDSGVPEPGREPQWLDPLAAIEKLSFKECAVLIENSLKIITQRTEYSTKACFSTGE